jgi:hypothetical protein
MMRSSRKPKDGSEIIMRVQNRNSKRKDFQLNRGWWMVDRFVVLFIATASSLGFKLGCWAVI